MGISHVQERLLAISRIPQADIQTAVPAVTSNPLAYVECLVKDQNLTSLTPVVKDNDGFSTRSDFPTETYLVNWDASTSHTFQLDVEMIGRLLYAALGAVTTTQPDSVGSPLVYQHAFKPMAPFTGRQLPFYTYIEKLGTSSLDQKYLGYVVERLTLRGNGADRVEVEVQFRGSGKRVSPSSIVFTAGGSNNVRPATGLRYLLNTQALFRASNYNLITCTFVNATDKVQKNAHGLTNGTAIRFGNIGGALPTGLFPATTYYVIAQTTNDFQVSLTPGGAAVNFTTDGSGTNGYSVVTNYSSACRFRSWEISFQNNLLADDGYCPGSAVYQTANDPTSGLVRNELLFGKRSYTAKFTIRVDSSRRRLICRST
jgi:hypothetical protein